MRCDKALKFLPKGDNNFMKHEKIIPFAKQLLS